MSGLPTPTPVHAPCSNPGFSAYKTSAVAFLIVCGLLLPTGRTELLRDPGTFWHIVVGERIVFEQELIYEDPFSFTFAGEPWIAQQWLAECLMAVVYSASGFTGMVLLSATAVAASFALGAFRLRRAGLTVLPTLMIVLLATAAVGGHLHARPHIVTLALLPLTFATLLDYENGRFNLPRLFWLVPLFILWVNLHGGVLGGIVTVWMAVLGWTIFWRLGLRSPITSWRETVFLLGLCVTLSATIFLNPYGVRLPGTWFHLMSLDLSFIEEHAPLNPRTLIGQLTLLLALIYATVLLRVRIRDMQICWLIPIVWLQLGISRIRHAPLFSILVVFALAELLPHSSWAKYLQERGWLQSSSKVPPGRRWPMGGIILMIVLLFVWAGLWRHTHRAELWAKPGRDVWPEELMITIRQFDSEHPIGTRIFNEMSYGGFLIYHAPKLRVFVDDRCELYGESFLRDCLSAYQHPEILNEWAEIYDFRVALVAENSSLDQFLRRSEDWTVLSTGSGAVLYQKR